MTTSNLALLVLVTTVVFFITSRVARKNNNPQLQLLVKAMRIFILALVAVYFYKRFVG
ncbi:MAG: hypothetical protein ABJN69_17520 [Hellea sp.]